MQNDIARYVTRCPECIKSKSGIPKKPKVELKSIEAERPGEIVAMDLLGGLPTSWGGKSYVMVMSDLFTKYARFVSLPAIDTVTVADALLKEWLLLFGPPERLLTDRGVQFTSELFVELMKALEIKKIFTTAYHPQTDGQVERLNKTLVNILRTNMDEYQQGWEDALPFAEYAYNTSVHTSTGETPYMMMYKQDPLPFTTAEAMANFPKTLRGRTTSEKDHQKWAKEVSRRFAKVHEKVRERLQAARKRQKKYYDLQLHEEDFKEGDLVYLYHPAVKPGRTKKLSQPWRCPFKIKKMLTRENVELAEVDNEECVGRVHLNRLKRCPEGSLELYPLSKEGREAQLEEEFEVIKKITADRRTPEGRYFKVTWEGLEDRTWEPEENLPPAAIRDYLKSKSARAVQKKKRGQRRG